MSEIFHKFIEFLGSAFTVKASKKSKLIGLSLTTALMIVIIVFNGSFISGGSASRWLLYSLAFLLAIFIGVLTSFSVKINNEKLKKVLYIILFFLFPLLTITVTECLNNIWIYDMTILGFIGNYIVIIIFYLLFFALTGSLRVSAISVSSIFYILAVIHAYLMGFRGTPFIPMDLIGIKTAANVGSSYDYTPRDIVILGTMLFIVHIIIAARITTPKFRNLTKIITRSFSAVFCIVVFTTFYGTDVFAKAGVQPYFWNQTLGYKNYGFAYNFVCNTRYLYYPKPKDYTPTKAREYVISKSRDYQTNTSDTKKPNIICIMNESLSDLSVLGDVPTNAEYMPYMSSLTENTIKGNLYVPVIGGGTSNTEFEFLTGHSTAFLPSGSNAYMLYVKNPIASMVSTLTAQGYSSAAFHPYYASGWNRVDVYNNMGFDKFTSLEDLLDPEILEIYSKGSSDADYIQEIITNNYPEKSNMLLRKYVSDSYDFEYLINNFKNRDKSKPYYMFNVTMQNHGGYLTSSSNFVPEVHLTSQNSAKYVMTNNYLSLVKKSDDAFKELIEYFKTVDEPTVICMFGDHQPSIEQDFVAETLGISDLGKLTLEQDQARHVTPFIIWANYDIEEQTIDKLSSNYLSSLVLKTANVQLSEYNKYLLELSKTLPVIDTVGYIDKDNNYYNWSSPSQYTDLLKEYELIQYNNIFDYENQDAETFFINGYTVNDIAQALEKKKGKQ